jgi:PAS domain S-box-containing protein/diguanylate cyclase (GGDEF)-like protein
MAGLVDPDDAGLPDAEQPDLRRLAQPRRDVEMRRGELVANAGHELKTPLSIILGLSGRLLSATDDGSAEHRDAERIRANAYGLVKQVDDLLQAAQIEDGRIEIEPVDCDVAALLRDAATGFQTLMDERDQRLVLRTPGRVPARVDEARLGTVVTNLVANAVRYAPRGGIVRCSLFAGGGRLRIEVADSGPGVPAAERDAIFERFRQVPGDPHRRPGGTGLGLAIVRELVALLGGTIVAGDAPEGGALFVVDLDHEPAVAAPAGPRPLIGLTPADRERATIEALKLELRAVDRRRAEPGAHAARRRGARSLPRVLLVEPSAELGIYLEELLGEDYDVRRAGSTAEAVRIVARTPVEAVLVDVGGAGGEALLASVQLPELEGVPVVVLAGDPEQARLLVRDRADDYAVKPFAETLLVRLGSVVGRRRAESARAAADARFRAVFEHAPTGMALATPEGRLLEVNVALARLLGLRRDAPRDLTLDALTHPDDLLDAPSSLVPADDEVVRLERRLIAADGRIVAAALTISVIREDAAPLQLVVQVEESRARGREAWVLVRVLTAQLARCVRYDEHAALLLVEIDELEAIGDAAARLRIAAAVAGAVRGRLRRSDVLVPLGERRFAALLVNAQVPAATAVARGVRTAVEETSVPDGTTLRAAVGVCAFDAGATATRIVAEAESALARARRVGGVATSGTP